MKFDDQILELMRCPLSGDVLVRQGQELHAMDSGQTYPLVNGVPWLLPNARNSLLDWGAKLHHFQQVLMAEIEQLAREIKSAPAVTQARLATLHAAKTAFLTGVSDIMRPVVTTRVAEKSLYDTLRHRAPSIQNLLSYEANLYRDWIWGDDENRAGAAIISKAAAGHNARRMLVLGAGSGRLALDLHRQLLPETTVATDINPLLLMAADRIFCGQSFDLFEFPQQPRKTDYVAVEHRFEGLDNWPAGLHLAFADAANSPFAANAFDLVVTPWLIDIQPHELGRFLRQLNGYVPLGGHWVNFGSLVFNQARDAHCYSIEELTSVAHEHGFTLNDPVETEMPYLKSPYNAGYRMERVWSWRAEKTAEVAPRKDVQTLPEWLLDVQKPIPRARYLQAFEKQHRMFAELASEVDGSTSIKAIGRRLARQNRADPAEATRMVRNFFLDVYQQNHPV